MQSSRHFGYFAVSQRNSAGTPMARGCALRRRRRRCDGAAAAGVVQLPATDAGAARRARNHALQLTQAWAQTHTPRCNVARVQLLGSAQGRARGRNLLWTLNFCFSCPVSRTQSAKYVPPTSLIVALDWTPNANHVGFYVAAARGLYVARGLAVSFRLSEADNYALVPAKAVLRGEAHLAVGPSETAIANATGAEAQLVAVATLLQHDTSAIAALASSDVARPRDLDGRTYTSYAARFELATVRAMIRADDGRGELTEVVPPRLACFEEVLAGRAVATWIFSPHEGVQAAAAGVPLRAFRPTDYGVPYGYSPVLLAAPALLAAKPAALRAFLAASAEGFAAAAAEPRAAADALRAEARHASLADAKFARASVAAAAPAFLDAAGAWGRMQPQRWEDFIAFLEREGLLVDRGCAPLPPAHRPTASRISTNDFLPPG